MADISKLQLPVQQNENNQPNRKQQENQAIFSMIEANRQDLNNFIQSYPPQEEMVNVIQSSQNQLNLKRELDRMNDIIIGLSKDIGPLQN